MQPSVVIGVLVYDDLEGKKSSLLQKYKQKECIHVVLLDMLLSWVTVSCKLCEMCIKLARCILCFLMCMLSFFNKIRFGLQYNFDRCVF